MSYEINVSMNGRHLFATAERSLRTQDNVDTVFAVLNEVFKNHSNIKMSVSKQETTNYGLTDYFTQRHDVISKLVNGETRCDILVWFAYYDENKHEGIWEPGPDIIQNNQEGFYWMLDVEFIKHYPLSSCYSFIDLETNEQHRIGETEIGTHCRIRN